jgi:hypothetical protein
MIDDPSFLPAAKTQPKHQTFRQVLSHPVAASLPEDLRAQSMMTMLHVYADSVRIEVKNLMM